MQRTMSAARNPKITAPREKTAIQVIERMMNLLDTLAAHADPVSLKVLSQTTKLHASTAHRILNDMVVGRFVDRGDTPGSYRLGMRLLELGVRCFAAGIRDDSGRIVAGLSLTAPAERMQDAWMGDVLDTAAAISARLGHAAAAPA